MSMIVLAAVAPDSLAMFGETPGGAVPPAGGGGVISGATGTLYHWNAGRRLREELGCVAPPPPEPEVLERIRADMETLKDTPGALGGAEKKIHVLRELFVLRDGFEGLGDQKTVQRINHDFLSPLKRGALHVAIVGETYAGVESILDDTLAHDPIEAYSLLAAFKRWRRFDQGLVDVLFRNLGDVSTVVSRVVDKALPILRSRSDLASRILAYHLLAAENRRSDRFFGDTVRELQSRLDRHLKSLLELRASGDLRMLLRSSEIERRIASWLPDTRGKLVSEALESLQPFREVLELRYPALVRHQELEGRALDEASRHLSLLEPGPALARIGKIRSGAEALGLRLPEAATKIEEQAHRIEVHQQEIAGFRDRVAGLGEGGRLDEARTAVAAFSLGIGAVDVAGMKAALLAEIGARLQRAQAEADELELARRLPELLMHCDRFEGTAEVRARGAEIRRCLGRSDLHHVAFDGHDVLWFGKPAVLFHRGNPEADFHLTNRAISRAPFRLGIEAGEAFVELEDGMKTPMMVETKGWRLDLSPGVKARLGLAGKIVFSHHFLLAYRVHGGRFLLLCLEPPDAAVFRAATGWEVADVWPDWEEETRHPLLVGI